MEKTKETHLMDPIHDEVRFEVSRIESSTLKELRAHVQFLAWTEEQELNKQRWRGREMMAAPAPPAPRWR